MNKLPVAKRAAILQMLCEGSSMRAITRVTGVSLNTVTKLLIDAGKACWAYHDEHVRGVKATHSPRRRHFCFPDTGRTIPRRLH